MSDIRDLSRILGGTADSHLSDPVSSSEYSIEHLDYGYIEKCDNFKELQKLLRILRSGREGYYPDLESFIEERMNQLDSSYLPKETKEALLKSGKQEAEQELRKWVKELKASEEHVRREQQNIKSSSVHSNSRQFFSSNQEQQQQQQNSSSSHINYGQTEEERLYLAEMEKCKGNDAFKCGDYDEAIDYYTLSLDIVDRAIVYNNRALAFLKVKKNKSAEADATKALSFDNIEDNTRFKALLRRGQARYNELKMKEAHLDLLEARQIMPENVELQSLLKQVETKLNSRPMRRMRIQEVAEELSSTTESAITNLVATTNNISEMNSTAYPSSTPVRGVKRTSEEALIDEPDTPVIAAAAEPLTLDHSTEIQKPSTQATIDDESHAESPSIVLEEIKEDKIIIGDALEIDFSDSDDEDQNHGSHAEDGTIDSVIMSNNDKKDGTLESTMASLSIKDNSLASSPAHILISACKNSSTVPSFRPAQTSAEFESAIKAIKRKHTSSSKDKLGSDITEYLNHYSEDQLITFVTNMIDADLFELALTYLLTLEDKRKNVVQAVVLDKKVSVFMKMVRKSLTKEIETILKA